MSEGACKSKRGNFSFAAVPVACTVFLQKEISCVINRKPITVRFLFPGHVYLSKLSHFYQCKLVFNE